MYRKLKLLQTDLTNYRVKFDQLKNQMAEKVMKFILILISYNFNILGKGQE